jgi:putative OPT family oligopeptide transporter
MQPFVPSDQNLKEFSFRAILIGLVLCIVLGAANAYLGLRAGMTIAATYPAAVIGMALIKVLKGTILEENIARTVGSIGESVAAGAIFTLPAFVISGLWPRFFTPGHYLTSGLIMFCGGLLGIMFVALLRRVMVEDAELPYPESVAASEIHKAGQGGSSGTSFLFGAMGLGGLIQVLNSLSLYATTWVKWLPFNATGFKLLKGKTAAAQGGLVLTNPGISPAFMGVGYIIGPKLAGLTFSGGVMAWGLLVPIITYFLAPGLGLENPNADEWIALSRLVFGGIVKPIAIGGMLVGSGFTLFKMRNSLITGLKRSVADVKKAASSDGHVVDRINQDLKFTWILMGIAAAGVITAAIAMTIFGTGFLVAVVAGLLAIILGFFFAAVSGYLVGIIGSSNNPMSGLTLTALVVTALVMVILGVKGNPGIAAVLGIAAIVCVSSGVAGEMLQDLKVGHILGGTPWRMELGDIFGVVLAAGMLFLPLAMLHIADINTAAGKEIRARKEAQVQVVTYEHDGSPTAVAKAQALGLQAGADYTLAQVEAMGPDAQNEVLKLKAGFGSAELPAPQAGLMADLSRGIVEGRMQWALIIVGMFMGLAFVLMQVKSPMMVSVGMYLPFSTTFAIFLGGCVKGIVELVGAKRGLTETQKAKVENAGVLVAAGLIAGEALIGLVFAGLAGAKVDFAVFKTPGLFPISLVILAVVSLVLVLWPLKDPGPAEPKA